MKNKIIGVTVGTPNPRANLGQTDPKKADYINNRPVEKTDKMTQPVGIDENGDLWTEPVENPAAIEAAEQANEAKEAAQAAAATAEQSAENASQSWASAENAKAFAETAKNEAQSIKTEVERKLANGDYKGEKGDKGDTGSTPKFTADEIITLPAGSSAYVYIHNDDPENPVIDFGIPQGEKGDKGEDGKSAYAYAQDGGYAGTEAEFAELLAKNDDSVVVSRAIGTTYPPSQTPASADFNGYDIDLLNSTASNMYAYIDTVVGGKSTVTKEILGKDASGKYNIARYTYAKRDSIAWVRQNYPKMYAWKNGNTIKYTESVSPRISDKAYSVPYVETSGTQTVVVPAKACILKGFRYSSSGGTFTAETGTASIILPLPKNPTQAPVITLVGMTHHAVKTYVYGGTTNTAFPTTIGKTVSSDKTVITIITDLEQLGGFSYITFFIDDIGDYSSAKILLNGAELAFEVTTDVDAVGGIASQESTTTQVVEGGGTPITAVSATKRSRTIDGVEYVRYTDGDVKPTVIYTDIGDSRNSNTSITQDGITYNRYPLGDLGANRQKLIPVFIYANEHGVIKDLASSENHEGKMPALVAARMLRDFAADKQEANPLYKYVRENCMLIVIPVANPFGFNFNLTEDTNGYTGYYNANTVNINRNYDTPGYDVFAAENSGVADGSYAGSEIETQYVMNTMVESGAVVAMSLHGFASGNSACAHQGQNPNNVDYDQAKLSKINRFLKDNWGYSLVYYDEAPLMNTPELTAKSPSYITQCGAYGGIVEISPDDNRTSGLKQEANQHVCENAYAQVINLLAMWLSDYLDSL